MDLRHILRAFRRSPGFCLVAIGTLGVAIGATVTIFSVADAVLIRPVPYSHPDRLVQIWGQNLRRNIPFHTVAYPDVAAWRKEARAFSLVAALSMGSASLAGHGVPETVRLARVNAELLPMLGTTLAAGRGFMPEEDRPGANPVAVVSHPLWQRRFGGQMSALGQRITLDGQSYTIVGVLPDSFLSPEAGQRANSAEVLIPLADDGARDDGPPTSALVFARLRPGVTRQQAQADIDRLSRSLDERFPAGPLPRSVRVWGLEEFRTRDVRVSLLVLSGAVTMVLLVACVNVANLLLARAPLRRLEMTLRLALGAGRRRLVAELLAESAVLAGAACVVGIGLAFWALKGLSAIGEARVPSIGQAGIDLRAAAFALGASALTVLLFGLGPALALSRPSSLSSLQGRLKASGRSQVGGLGLRLRHALVAVEVALSLILLVGAALLLQSFTRLQQVQPGFNPRGVLTASIALNADRYRDPAQQAAFFKRLIEDLQARPGVASVGITSLLPLSGNNQGTYMLGDSGAVTRLEDAPIVWFRRVSAGYFRATQIPLVRGRYFDPVEERNARTVIINEEMAAQYWPGQDPVGRQLRPPPPRDPRVPAAPPVTVIGVVGSVRHMRLSAKPEPELYMPFQQAPGRAAFVVVRTSLDPESLAPLLSTAARTIDPEQAVSQVRTFESLVALSTSSQRLSTTLLLAFAVIAATLAVVGLCGVTSYLVSQRTQEIGVRMALGAQRADVWRLVLGEGMTATVAGIVIGLAGAAAATRVIETMLFGVTRWNPLAFSVGPVVLALGALVGIWWPARRATAVDPLAALREQ